MNYITKPPVIRSIPLFLAKRFGLFDATLVNDLVAWARKEYYDMIGYLYTVNIEQAKVLESPRYSYLDFLARCHTFKKVVDNMNDEVWNSLDRSTRNTLIQAKSILDNS